MPAALGLFAPLVVRLLGTPSVVLLHNLVDTVDLEDPPVVQRLTENQPVRPIGVADLDLTGGPTL